MFVPGATGQKGLERPKVNFKATRLNATACEQLEAMIEARIAGVLGQESLRKDEQELGLMIKNGRFDLEADQRRDQRIGLRTPNPGGDEKVVGGYSMVKTPMLLPGQGVASPLMTFGSIAGTPQLLGSGEREGVMPTFRMAEATSREEVGQKLAAGAAKRIREQKAKAKAKRLEAMGVDPALASRLGVTPSPAPSKRAQTPGSVLHSLGSRLSPGSPISAMLRNAERAARGLGMPSSMSRPNSSSRTPVPSTPGGAASNNGAAAGKRRQRSNDGAPPAEAEGGGASKRRRDDLDASITDGLMGI